MSSARVLSSSRPWGCKVFQGVPSPLSIDAGIRRGWLEGKSSVWSCTACRSVLNTPDPRLAQAAVGTPLHAQAGVLVNPCRAQGPFQLTRQGGTALGAALESQLAAPIPERALGVMQLRWGARPMQSRG